VQSTATSMTRNFFRLSILQLLVAMTVVAGFVAANRIPERREVRSVEVLFFGNEFGRMDQLEYRLGWPLTYYRALTFVPVGEGRSIASPYDYTVGEGEIKLAAIAANTALAFATVIGSLMLVVAISRKRSS
jgi:hypothetical protein